MSELIQFEEWLRTVCFQKPTPDAYDLAKCAWIESRKQAESANSALLDEAKRHSEFMNGSGWRPIDTAPLDGSYILVTNPESGGAWVAKYDPVYPSGYRPENPWSCMMLNTWHLKPHHSTVPTHWQQMPQALQQSTPTPVSATTGNTSMEVTQQMIDRFLSWKLPEDFSPDCGVSFDKRPPDAKGYARPWPVGTSLLTATQARQMLEHVLQAPTPLEQKKADPVYDKLSGFYVDAPLEQSGEV